jgi:hypothetical protein
METNIYLTRHLQRIDDTSSYDKTLELKWRNVDEKDIRYKINPYLVDIAKDPKNIQDVLKKIPSKTINVIISSPFLRCIQTSLLLRNQINKLKEEDHLEPIKQIHINFGLSEIIDDAIFYPVTTPINIREIFEFSKDYLSANEGLSPDILLESECIPEIYDDEIDFKKTPEDEKYRVRIKQTLHKIYEKYSGQNILIVTHADSGIIFPPFKKLDYTDHRVIHVNPKDITQSGGLSNNFKSKYLKYKNKYLLLKKSY